MKKGFKFLTILFAVFCFTQGFGSIFTLASTYDKPNKIVEIQELSYGIITPMSATCDNCGMGYMITTPHSATFLDHTELCSKRVDCSIAVFRTDYWYTSKCNNCGVGYSWTGSSTYSYSHSKSH